MIKNEHENKIPLATISAGQEHGLALNHAKLPTRRDFFRKFGRGVAVAEASFLVAWPILPISLSVIEINFPSRKSAYPCTDLMIHSPYGELRNLGVQHLVAFFNQRKDHLSKRISEADIVLVESLGTGKKEDGKFFDLFREECLRLKKRIIGIDMSGDVTNPRYIGLLAMNILSLSAGFRLKTDLQKSKVGATINKTRRAVLRLIGWTGATFGASTPAAAFAEIGVLSSSIDMGYTNDARTVFMLDDLLRAQRENPGAKILIMTGDAHAQGIQHYLSSADKFALFEKKLAIYSKSYGKIFDRRYEEIK